MNPFRPGQSPFMTSADSRFNSFTAPSAMAYTQGNGQWQVDPNMMTPAYTAAYRPQYNGNQGNPYGGPQPTWMQSANQIINPFARYGSNYGGNTYQQQSPFADALGYNPLDHGMNIAQKWAVPGFASWLSYKYMAKPLGEMGSRMAGGMATGIMGDAFSAGTTATLGSMAAGLGRFAGSIGGPMIFAQAGISAADRAFFDPYIAQRQTTNNLRRDFAGVSFGSGMGNALTGKGFSRSSAGELASQINQIGASDYTFSQSEVSKLTDLSARSGLLDTTQGSQIAQRMKDITKQVKLVMQIGNTSDFKDTIEILSKLQMSGVGSKDVTSVLTKLGGMASVAGVSLQKMMSTVGAQGEYLFGANGLNPYAGQLTAANSYGAFAMAQRTGLMSPALLARMGGVEGATQSATGALLGMSQTPLAGMMQYNRYLNGGAGGGAVGNISRFGGAMARGGLSALGTFEYERPLMSSMDLENGGMSREMGQLMSIAQITPGAMKGGRIDAGAAYMMLQQVMGLTPQQARAFVERQRAAQDPTVARQSISAIGNAWKETRLKSMQQEGRYGIATGITRPIHLLAQRVQAGGSRAVSNFMEPIDSAIDTLDVWGAGSGAQIANPFGSVSGDEQLNTNYTDDQVLAINGRRLPGNGMITFGFGSSDYNRAAKALKGNAKLTEAVYKQDLAGIKEQLSAAVANGTLGDSFNDPARLNSLAKLLLKNGRVTTGKGSAAAKLASLLRVTHTKSRADAAKMNLLVEKIAKAGGDVTKDDINEFNTLIHATPATRVTSRNEILQRLDLMNLQETYGENSTKHWKILGGDETGSASNFSQSASLLTSKDTYARQADALAKAASGKGPQMDFSGINVAMGLLGQAVDPHQKALRVVNVKGSATEIANDGTPVESVFSSKGFSRLMNDIHNK